MAGFVGSGSVVLRLPGKFRQSAASIFHALDRQLVPRAHLEAAHEVGDLGVTELTSEIQSRPLSAAAARRSTLPYPIGQGDFGPW